MISRVTIPADDQPKALVLYTFSQKTWRYIEQKKNPKIYPKKIIDINFLVESLDLENFKVNISRLDNFSEETIVVSKMYFRKFGNELGYQHYKDIFKIILIDIVMRISDQELKKIIKGYYLNQ